MATANLEERVAALESEVARLKAALRQRGTSRTRWWEQIAGTFADDPAHEEAMKLGREYRESLRPKSRKRRDGRSGH